MLQEMFYCNVIVDLIEILVHKVPFPLRAQAPINRYSAVKAIEASPNLKHFRRARKPASDTCVENDGRWNGLSSEEGKSGKPGCRNCTVRSENERQTQTQA